MASKDCSSNYADDVLAKLEDVGGLTPLQKHAAFFDRNKDGKIYPRETYQGFRAIGCGVALSVAAAAFINGTLGLKTKPGKFPSLLFPIYVKNIKKGMHGSDTGAYDIEGRFVSEKFEEIFKKHALTNSDAITKEELKQMLRANRVPKDYSGRFASFVEWTVLYSLCKDKNGLVHRESVRAVYDGSIFIKLEKERTAAKEERDLRKKNIY